MTWLAQVRHVMRKDLLHARWLVVAYAAVVALATARVMTLPAMSGPLFSASALLVVLLGIVAAASLVQSDSPTRSTAFWASKPFYPSAMMMAKLLLTAALVAAPPLLAQIIGLLSFAVPGREMPSILGDSASTYALWLLAAILVAALTRDLRTFVLTFVAIPIVLLIAAEVVTSPRTAPEPNQGHALWAGIMVVGVCGGLATLAILYHRRDARRGVRAAALVAVACMLVVAAVAPSTAMVETPPAVPRPQLRIALVAPDTISRRQQWYLQVFADGVSGSDLLTLLADTITFHLRDGSTLHAAGMEPFKPLFTPPLPVKGDVRWLGERASEHAATPSVEIVPRLTNEQERLLEQRGVASVELVGRVWMRAPRTVAAISFAEGQSLTRNGRRFRIASASHGPEGAKVEVLTSTVSRPQAQVPRPIGWRAGQGDLSFALVNESRGEAMHLGNSANSVEGDWLVLPGTSLMHESFSLASQHQWPPSSAYDRDDAWYAGAQLMIVEWTALGSYPVRVRSAAP